ncbi:MAG: transglycosylase SLT domain-containing protein [Chitinophagales bacterium]|nr:transglycosylase SLT domain-containing protein [Sphingobacteriales bacterium]MBP9141572.1 transglycosylase SLT domain-containing protein [Chitinophagales bacterium]MDA0198675.1 transglycosylase SLT domain-containing protein [Bacteroidota bacterium]MBK6889819.1 transglycosylase SLT domain-containing protein [Sphingobacteriales bacterium]MBL0247828.1 transglycosylase SLT domain-containing protein [Sphingobacteriales bacterium]
MFLEPNPETINLPPATLALFSSEEYSRKISLIKSELPLICNNQVVRQIESYTGRNKELSQKVLGLTTVYFPVFEQILVANGVPIDFKYLTIIESALNPNAGSPMGARGLWQFMPGTARSYGLKINNYLDERRDPHRSTEAAAKYLSRLYDEFGDWFLVLAAYNCGDAKVKRIVKQLGGNVSYWDIQPYLPRETRNFVPAFIATMYWINYYFDHDLQYTMPLDPPNFNSSDTLLLRGRIKLETVANYLKMPLSKFQALNPALVKSEIPADNKHYPLRVPFIEKYELSQNIKAIYDGNIPEPVDADPTPTPNYIAWEANSEETKEAKAKEENDGFTVSYPSTYNMPTDDSAIPPIDDDKTYYIDADGNIAWKLITPIAGKTTAMAKKNPDKPAKRNKVSAKNAKPTVKIVQETIENTNIAAEEIIPEPATDDYYIDENGYIAWEPVTKISKPDADEPATKLSTKEKVTKKAGTSKKTATSKPKSITTKDPIPAAKETIVTEIEKTTLLPPDEDINANNNTPETENNGENNDTYFYDENGNIAWIPVGETTNTNTNTIVNTSGNNQSMQTLLDGNNEDEKFLDPKDYDDEIAISEKPTKKISAKNSQKPSVTTKKQQLKTITYTVKNGDSLWDIANKYPLNSVSVIKKNNKLKGNALDVGMKLKLLAK